MDYKYITKLYGTLVRHLAFSHDDSLVAISGEATYIGTIGGSPLFRGNFRDDYEKFYYNLIPQHFRNLTIGEAKWSPDDKFLYCIAGGEVYRFSVERQEFKQLFKAGENSRTELKCLAMNEKKQVLVAAGLGADQGKEDHIYVLDFAGKLLFSIPSKHGPQINSVQFSPDGTKILSTGKDHILRVWSADNGALLSEINTEADNNSVGLVGFINETTVLVNLAPYPAYTIDATGKASLLKKFVSLLPKNTKVLGYYPSKHLLICNDGSNGSSTIKTFNHDGQEQGTLEIHNQLEFVTAGNAHDLLAVTLRTQVASPEVQFFSTEPASNFLSANATAGTWVVDSSMSDKVRGWHFMMPYEKYPGLWIGIGSYKILIYDAGFNVKHEFKYTTYDFQKARFHAKSQKGAFFRGDNQLFIIDFNKLDLQGTILPQPQEAGRIKTEGSIEDFQWNNAGDKLAAITSNRRELVIWGGPNFAEIHKTPTIPSIRRLTWSTDDSIIALAADKTTFHYFDVAKKAIVKTLIAMGMSRIDEMTWNNTRNEIILTGDQFICIFNQDGNPLRKVDLRAESQEYMHIVLPTCSPTTHEISLVVEITREGDFHYILDLDKPFRQCITARLRHHMKGINFIEWDQPNRIITMGKSDGLAIWQRK